MTSSHRIEIDGHLVDADQADLFYSGADGRRITDEEWDETQRRIREHELADALESEVGDGHLR